VPRSLWTRLMGVFLGVILLGFVVMVVSVRITTATQLKRRVLSDDVAQASELASLMSAYYADQGSWTGVEAWLESAGVAEPSGRSGWSVGPEIVDWDTMGPGMMGEWMGSLFSIARSSGPLADRVVLFDASGKVITDTGGASLNELHPPDHLESAVPVVVDGDTVGAVLVGSMIEPVLNPADEDFLKAVNLSILITTVTVGLLALVLGSLLFRQITSPLRSVSRAAEAIAAGQLGRRVRVDSQDEIGRLAQSFNRMAESLAQAEVQRRNMVADIAHELRTPLTVIQGGLEAMLDGVYEVDEENLTALHEQTGLLGRLVADLRDLALAEAGQLMLDWQEVDLEAMIVQASEGLQSQAREKGVTLKTDLPEGLPEIHGDQQRLQQVVFNLLSNALHHTRAGGTITIGAEAKEDRVVVRVQDTGSGIPPEDLPHVFERFYRADRSRARATGGSGLGLTIAKRIVEAHGGQIWVQSWQGAGSTFAFSLPLQHRQSASEAQDERAQEPAACPSCGKPIETGWRLCAYCGEPVA